MRHLVIALAILTAATVGCAAPSASTTVKFPGQSRAEIVSDASRKLATAGYTVKNSDAEAGFIQAEKPLTGPLAGDDHAYPVTITVEGDVATIKVDRIRGTVGNESTSSIAAKTADAIRPAK
jgi:hypothetical protein